MGTGLGDFSLDPLFVSLNFVPYVLPTQKNKVFLNTVAGHRLLKCSLSLYSYLTIILQ